MNKLKTKNEKMLLLIGVDVGNGDTKTANSKIHTGIKTVQDASIAKNVLLMDGITSIMGEGHIAYMEDRTIDENYRRLTCQAIANEVRINGMTPGTYEIYLGVGVPFQHWNGMKDRMKSYLIQGNVDLNLPEEWTSCIDFGVKEYCEQVFSMLREHGYSDDYTKLVFLGGGASVVKKYCKDSYRFDFITDVHANAKGYEEFYYRNLLRKGEICE